MHIANISLSEFAWIYNIKIPTSKRKCANCVIVTVCFVFVLSDGHILFGLHHIRSRDKNERKLVQLPSFIYIYIYLVYLQPKTRTMHIFFYIVNDILIKDYLFLFIYGLARASEKPYIYRVFILYSKRQMANGRRRTIHANAL